MLQHILLRSKLNDSHFLIKSSTALNVSVNTILSITHTISKKNIHKLVGSTENANENTVFRDINHFHTITHIELILHFTFEIFRPVFSEKGLSRTGSNSKLFWFHRIPSNIYEKHAVWLFCWSRSVSYTCWKVGSRSIAMCEWLKRNGEVKTTNRSGSLERNHGSNSLCCCCYCCWCYFRCTWQSFRLYSHELYWNTSYDESTSLWWCFFVGKCG